jgi:hypothetical protein
MENAMNDEQVEATAIYWQSRPNIRLKRRRKIMKPLINIELVHDSNRVPPKFKYRAFEACLPN